MLTVKETADKYCVTERQILYAIKKKLLPATKFGWQWLLSEEDLPSKFPVRAYKKEFIEDRRSVK